MPLGRLLNREFQDISSTLISQFLASPPYSCPWNAMWRRSIASFDRSVKCYGVAGRGVKFLPVGVTRLRVPGREGALHLRKVVRHQPKNNDNDVGSDHHVVFSCIQS